MSLLGYIGFLASVLGVLACFCLNRKFRTEIFGMAWKWKIVWLVPTLAYLLVGFGFGFPLANKLTPAVLGLSLQGVFMVLAMIMQWVAMMWIMARPRIDWYMPGETYDSLTWDDYVGNDEIRDRIKQIMDFIENPEKYQSLGAKLPKGVLLLGPPGVGKTYLARIIANMCGVPIAICESTSMQSPFMAVASMMVKALYKKLNKYAKQYGASMVFFDEIDAIGMSRSGPNNQSGGGMSPMGFMGGGSGGILNALLGCMDGINGVEGFFKKFLRRIGFISAKKKPQAGTVITFGATNAPISVLDAALVRDGRFDWKFTVSVAGDEGREKQIKYFLAKVPHDKTCDVGYLTSDFRGMTPVEISACLNNAIIRAIGAGRREATYEDVIKSLWDRSFGLPEPINLSPLDEDRVAKHEAGHGVMAVWFPMTGWSCWGATVRPRGSALGMVMSKPMVEMHTQTIEDLSRRILLSVGARAVEETVMRTKMSGASGDLSSATAVARAMVASYGMLDRVVSLDAMGLGNSDAVAAEVDMLVLAHLELAKELLLANPDAVKALWEALKVEKDLDGRRVQAIVLESSDFEYPEEYSIWALVEPKYRAIKDEKETEKMRKMKAFNDAQSAATGKKGRKAAPVAALPAPEAAPQG
jgi:cell division protease FtsH